MSPTAISEYPPAPPSKIGEPAWNVALLFPKQGQWTESEYFALDTNRLVELSAGCLEVLPMPNLSHQWIVRFLFLLFHEFTTKHSLGEAYFAPLPVRLWEGKIREPDILVVRADGSHFEGKFPEGAELVVEVVSEGAESRKRDLQEKPADYAEAGVPEYWIVDPEQQQITVLTLSEGRYRQHGCFALEDEATSVLLDGFSVSVKSALNVPDRRSETE